MTTIESALNAAAQALHAVSESPRLDAEILLSLALAKERSHLRAWPEKRLTLEQQRHFGELLQHRLSGLPIAYLTGHREFWSREFEVNPDVLIPRPDTELLIELALQLIPEDTPYPLIDLGTGSGIIAITLAAERPLAKVTATDISPKALAIARRNADKHRIRNIVFAESNWLDDLPADIQFNLVVSNPPYIDPADPHLKEGDVRFEPQSALVADNQGLNAIETIAAEARKHLQNPGHLLIEHGYDQQKPVQRILKGLNYRDIATYRDLAGQPRVSYGHWRP
ncbi:MAG: peptide chain release factor N(5)-glutamine methyltransferase [Gammaproteobacteria bacterium]